MGRLLMLEATPSLTTLIRPLYQNLFLKTLKEHILLSFYVQITENCVGNQIVCVCIGNIAVC